MIGDDIVINRSGKLLTKSYSIGLHGYIYLLTKVDDYFVAAPHSILVIPRRFSDIACIENTLLALFRFKHFYTSLIPALRKRIAANEIDIGSVCEMDAAFSDSTHVSQKFIFFKSKKRKHGASESEEDNYKNSLT
ncbi:hypothetical protein BCV72DRAFT_218373 [Rhizopus microsporus var. microsporus]|uniref:Uncharacterized protein n=1 Tax=Rhizopus microsporus var. microsporus TaxID=86635 RepID=A0A1X0QM79_RHIZD|nr:hypothetical protein BCV72DRAFT_218373 [Rhizopus microsporus var. microsporus]